MIRKYVVGAGAAIAAVFLTGCSNPQKEGVEALKNKNYEEAESQFQMIIEEKSGEKAAEAYRGLGLTYYEMKEYEKALEAFRNAVDGGAEQTVQLYNLMGICAIQTEDYESAKEYIQAGLAITETKSGSKAADTELIREMRYNEIICCEYVADWETAKQKVDEYLEDYPDDTGIIKEQEFLKTR